MEVADLPIRLGVLQLRLHSQESCCGLMYVLSSTKNCALPFVYV